MNIKEIVVSKFDKSKFKLLDCNTSDNNDSYECIDIGIRDFIIELNKCAHISTIYSCEGHKENDGGYLMFNVDDIGYDILFNNVMPELAYKFAENYSINDNFLSLDEDLIPCYHLDWYFQIINNKYNTGISIYKNRFKDIIHLGEIFVKWEDIKKRFWNTIKETFLNYYK